MPRSQEKRQERFGRISCRDYNRPARKWATHGFRGEIFGTESTSSSGRCSHRPGCPETSRRVNVDGGALPAASHLPQGRAVCISVPGSLTKGSPEGPAPGWAEHTVRVQLHGPLIPTNQGQLYLLSRAVRLRTNAAGISVRDHQG